MNAPTGETALLRVSGLEKSFGPVKVLRGVSFSLGRGRILGVVGENGAGKSTLMRCICGFTEPDAGAVECTGTARMVPQEFSLVPTLTVAENIFLGREKKRFGLVDRAAQNAAAAAALARIDSNLDPSAEVSLLGVADKQKTEIAKALVDRADLLVLDEPTTVLSRAETETLFRVLRKLRDDGVSMIYISHKLDEVIALCDEIAVMRDGVLVEKRTASGSTPRELASRMVGRPLGEIYPPHAPARLGDVPALAANGLSDGRAVKDATFTLYQGEILGLAGLAGAGRTELCELLCGERRRRSGSLKFFGEDVDFKSMGEAQSAGLAYLSEDRQGTALLVGFSLRDNVTLATLKRHARGPFLSFASADAAARARISELNVRCESTDQPASSLSGGNQQKIAIAKGLEIRPKVFLFDEPTRGVDVGARAEIYRIMHDLAADGVAILLVSSDLPEIIGNCERALVMRDGRIAGECSGADLTEENAIRLATGA